MNWSAAREPSSGSGGERRSVSGECGEIWGGSRSGSGSGGDGLRDQEPYYPRRLQGRQQQQDYTGDDDYPEKSSLAQIPPHDEQ